MINFDPSEVFVKEFGNVAAIASIYELKLRLLADKTSALKNKSHAHRLEDLEDAFISHFQEKLTDKGVTLLKTGRQLRNKLLHSDFSIAAKKVEELRPGTLQRGGVIRVDLSDGSTQAVSETDSRDTGIFGWLLESGMKGGLFEQCRIIFSQMIGIIAQISDDEAKRELAEHQSVTEPKKS
jgi:hypothetical protein